MLNLLKNSIILGEVIIRVNILIIEDIKIEKVFLFKPQGGTCCLNKWATVFSLALPLHTLYISYIFVFIWQFSSTQIAWIFACSYWQFYICCLSWGSLYVASNSLLYIFYFAYLVSNNLLQIFYFGYLPSIIILNNIIIFDKYNSHRYTIIKSPVSRRSRRLSNNFKSNY